MYGRLLPLALAMTAMAYPSAKPQGPIGGATPEPLDGQWTPPSHVYSNGPYKQVVYLSFDGMHQTDLVEYIEMFPNSTFASVVKNSIVFNNAKASKPSDSFPATIAPFTGASARVSGVYWQVTWAKDLYPPSSNCSGPIGSVADWSQVIDYNASSITGGNAFNLSALPMKLNSWGVCEPLFPHDYLRVNTVFEVGRANGLNTAYFDKHPGYEFVNGPSGLGLTQGYFPENAAVASTLEAQLAWDDLHWSALANVTAGHYVNGTGSIDFSIIGSNFNSITWAQSSGGGYSNCSTLANPIFSPNLTAAFHAADAKLGAFIKQLEAAGKLESTLLILSSKQGQSPVDESTLTLIDPQLVINATGVNVSLLTASDTGLIWLENGQDAVTAKNNLLAKAEELNIVNVLAGDEVWEYGFGNPRLDPRAPDVVILAKDGTLYESGATEDHGGWFPDDLDVPLVLYNPTFTHANISLEVRTTQIASTILAALGLPLAQLDGWRMEGSPVLPFIGLSNQ
ncbi:hypothetical protein CDV55_103702 [Aspergillus turcosus]|uniref:Uncharacterized protein n=1 Tax=Aspergillus turcosus TaxID=1245748 RepID=A0A397HBZ8_9EURO|nr:hypothetical protein CDV55_103702 [Aspergillus turcosus]RLM00307.1 hypothetical protein CFD26_106795 [Aspergillus turcosus]